MATTTLGFIVQRPPYKTENPKLALTHAIASQSVEVYLEDDDLVTADIAFVGDGVIDLNFPCVQSASSHERLFGCGVSIFDLPGIDDFSAIHVIGDDRMFQIRQVDTDLMGSAGLQVELQKRIPAKGFQHFIGW